MKNSTLTRKNFRVGFTQDDLCIVLGALAEHLEENRQPGTRSELAALVKLHSRLLFDAFGTEPEYKFLRNGSVVLAMSPDVVILPAPKSRARSDQTAQAASHG